MDVRMSGKKEYVYVMTHLPTGKKYVGRTNNPQRRYAEHMNALTHGTHYNKHLQSDYNKYGGDYQFDVVCVETKGDREGFLQDEKTLMRKLRTYNEKFGYNDKDPAMVIVRCAYGLS